MYCPKCGEENPEGAKFCMHCGADLSGYNVEISPKISVSAKAEGGVALKWKQEPYKHVEIKGYGKLPAYREFATLEEKPFCPLCGNYGCVEADDVRTDTYNNYHIFLHHCVACNKYFCCDRSSRRPGGFYY